jgi:CHASE2 domain-containing sensor protein
VAALDFNGMGGKRLNVFMSYRRAESPGHSGRIFDRLRAALPDADVFMDVESIEPGTDWRERLSERIRAADVVLVLIGKDWCSLTDANGVRRLHDPHDVTRWEIESALAQGKRVVPILLDDAAPLRADELPPSIGAIAELQAMRIRHDAFDAGMEQLIARLTGRRLRDEAEHSAARLRIEQAKRWLIPAIALAVVLLAWTRLFDLFTLDTRIATWTIALADAAAPLPLAPDLVLVAIGPEHDTRDPALRARFGEAIGELARAGARRIVLDIHFHEPRDADAGLAAAMAQARASGTEVFFSFIDANAGKPRAVPRLADAASGLGLACVGRRLGYAHTVAAAFDIRPANGRWRAAEQPSLALLGAAGKSRVVAVDAGHVELIHEGDGKPLRYRYSVLSNELTGTQGCPAMTAGTRTAELIVRLAPPATLRSHRVAFTDVLAGRLPPESFAGKTVVIGFESAGERFRVAHGLARIELFGYELHANAINVLQSGRAPVFAAPAAQAFLAGILATLGAAIGVRCRRLGGWPSSAAVLAAVALYIAAAVAAVVTEDLLLNAAYDLAALVFAYVLFRHLARRWLK